MLRGYRKERKHSAFLRKDLNSQSPWQTEYLFRAKYWGLRGKRQFNLKRGRLVLKCMPTPLPPNLHAACGLGDCVWAGSLMVVATAGLNRAKPHHPGLDINPPEFWRKPSDSHFWETEPQDRAGR